MGGIEDPHLALGQTRKAVAPQVVPDRQSPARSDSPRNPIKPRKNCVTSPPTGILPPMPIGQSQASKAATTARTASRSRQHLTRSRDEVETTGTDLDAVAPSQAPRFASQMRARKLGFTSSSRCDASRIDSRKFFQSRRSILHVEPATRQIGRTARDRFKPARSVLDSRSFAGSAGSSVATVGTGGASTIAATGRTKVTL